MKRKKVLMIHHSGLIGGGSMSMYNNWLQLRKKYDVTCYIPNDPPHLMKFLEEKGLKPKVYNFRLGKITYYNGGNNITNFKFWYHSFRALLQIPYWKKILKKENPDLIIVNSKVISWMGVLSKESKSLCFVRETTLNNPNNLINKFIHKLLDNFTVVSFLSEYDSKQTHLKRAEKMVSYNYLDTKNFEDTLGKERACSRLGISDRKFNIIFTGGIEELKGIDVAVKALKILNDENINLIVAGNSYDEFKINMNFRLLINKIKKRKSIRYARKVREYISDNGLDNNIYFLGTQKDMKNIYSASDILIFPMNSPHQARPVFEIGMQKKPVIITDFTNIKEFVEHGDNGLTFEAKNERDLAQCILAMKKNSKLRKKMGENNYRKTLKNHTISVSSKFIVNRIDELIN